MIDRHYRDGTNLTQQATMLSDHIKDEADYAYLVRSSSHRAAESLVYTLDSIVKFAGTAGEIAGKNDQYLIGGRFLASNVTLLEAIRVVANWQRHSIDWYDKPYSEDNFNHRVLKKLDLWGTEDVSVKFLKLLRRPSYFQFEQDMMGALEYLTCEIGMRHRKPGTTKYNSGLSRAETKKKAGK
jgi:hypothetical protein